MSYLYVFYVKPNKCHEMYEYQLVEVTLTYFKYCFFFGFILSLCIMTIPNCAFIFYIILLQIYQLKTNYTLNRFEYKI